MKKQHTAAWITGTVMMLAIVAVAGRFTAASADNGNGNGGEGGDGGSAVVTSTIVASSTMRGFAVAANAVANEGESAAVRSENGQGMQGMQESASLDANGNFKLTGAKVVSVDTGANTITATLYGITKTVGVGGAAITGGGATMTLGQIQAGDTISASGNVNETAHSVTVNAIVDVSAAQANTSAIQARINSLLQLVQQLQAQLQALTGGSH